MKKAMSIAAIAAAVVLMIVSIPMTNNAAATITRKRLTSLTPQAVYPIVETVAKVGRFVGNGDGAQYFAAVLLQTDAAEADVRAYYEPLGYGVTRQTTPQITVLDQQAPTLRTTFNPEYTYYLVYTVRAGVPLFAWLDIRGC